MKPAEPGSISHGTCRTEDLVETFSSRLDALLKAQPRGVPRAAHRKIVREAGRVLGWLGRMPDSHSARTELEFVCEELFEALESYAPDGHRFGAHEGDGSDFGFWPIPRDELVDAEALALDALDHAEAHGYVLGPDDEDMIETAIDEAAESRGLRLTEDQRREAVARAIQRVP